MKKIASALLVSLLAFTALPAMAQFGGLGALAGAAKGGGDAGDVEGQVKAFIQKSNDINGLIFVSLKTINAAYASVVAQAAPSIPYLGIRRMFRTVLMIAAAATAAERTSGRFCSMMPIVPT